MKYSNVIGVLAAVIIIASCFFPWITVPEVNIIVKGFDAGNTKFGKPGLVNSFMSVCAILLFLIPRIWAKRFNLFFTGFNLAWAIRNFILLATCRSGDCPIKQPALYVMLGASLLMIGMAMFTDLPLKDEPRSISGNSAGNKDESDL
ncbi:hypothetical protein [Flavihumibacter petaseus]|uniref:Uncharacterized protein n=1 Tax=Flavihumibacter petaseus NBRC 106054 TaxID=1220578 RepID=A0A0E9N202_9BACT|nr:hypothetical protein [Flavihumibacter petaseus]GAO43676.1 hypothetical protein FPE01S_02_07820 [Flavihumibacter petaseus NBRC 106054]